MTQQPETGDVPSFDIADRMRKALRHADIGVQEMADYLGVARNTVSTWINGRITPSSQTVRLWALRTGVPHDWLATGSTGPQNGGPRAQSRSRCTEPSWVTTLPTPLTVPTQRTHGDRDANVA